MLDLGCGIGRHVIYGFEMGLDAYGVDLSQTALAVAKKWTGEHGISPDRFQQADIKHLPWPDAFFDFVISHGVLDSMPFQSARLVIPEVARVLRGRGLFYCDLVSSKDGRHPPDFDGEEEVEGALEHGTTQSYFTVDKITRLIGGYFTLLDGVHTCRTQIDSEKGTARFHVVLQKN
jgi:ubiquinone/menaquinone biosynthesis C-methylase UbiE